MPEGAHLVLAVPGEVTPTGLTLPASLSFEEWETVGRALHRMTESVMWWYGDWWRYGERKYGEAAAQAVPTGYAAENLRQAAWVCDRIESVRRHTDLSFSHHYTVAALEPVEQDRFLDEAVEHGWTREKLRQAVKHRKRDAKERAEASAAGTDPVLFHCSVAELPDHVEAGTVDVIVTDPPYPREFLGCFSDLSHAGAKILKPGGLCAVMVGQSYLPEVIVRLSERLTYHWAITYLTPGGQAVQLWDRKVNTFWKPVLVFANGGYEGEWFGDVAKSDPNDNDKDHHHWGQSESGMADLIRRLSAPGDLVCDPFLGGGTTAVVAATIGRRVVACDIDETALETTRGRFG